jgi:hypothetical protein
VPRDFFIRGHQPGPTHDDPSTTGAGGTTHEHGYTRRAGGERRTNASDHGDGKFHENGSSIRVTVPREGVEDGPLLGGDSEVAYFSEVRPGRDRADRTGGPGRIERRG